MTSTVTKIGVSIAVLGAALVPAFAFADTGVLSVYMLVNNNDQVLHRAPQDFTVSVAGTNVYPAISKGTQHGTTVTIGEGSYSVSVINDQFGFIPTYSQGCTGTMHAGITALCIITMNPSYNFNSYPTPYPYSNVYQAFTCNSQVKTVGLRQNVSFTAQGGVGGTYNWQIPGRSYPNAGPVFTVSFDQTGTQLVTVTNATQTATCMIEVVQGGYYPTLTSTIYPSYPATSYGAYPHLPNTGVEPVTAYEVALALALLAGAAFTSAPYVRKAYAIVTK